MSRNVVYWLKRRLKEKSSTLICSAPQRPFGRVRRCALNGGHGALPGYGWLHRAIAQYAKPGGIVLTVIPNLTGTIGSLMKLLNRPNYDIHIPSGSKQLRADHEATGLRILRCEYFMSTSFGVLNLVGQDSTRRSTSVKRFVLENLGRFSVLVHVMEERIGNLPATRLMAPYVVCVAQAPKEE